MEEQRGRSRAAPSRSSPIRRLFGLFNLALVISASFWASPLASQLSLASNPQASPSCARRKTCEGRQRLSRSLKVFVKVFESKTFTQTPAQAARPNTEPLSRRADLRAFGRSVTWAKVRILVLAIKRSPDVRCCIRRAAAVLARLGGPMRRQARGLRARGCCSRIARGRTLLRRPSSRPVSRARVLPSADASARRARPPQR